MSACQTVCPFRHLSILLNSPAALSQLFQIIPLDDFTTPCQTIIGRAPSQPIGGSDHNNTTTSKTLSTSNQKPTQDGNNRATINKFAKCNEYEKCSSKIEISSWVMAAIALEYTGTLRPEGRIDKTM